MNYTISKDIEREIIKTAVESYRQVTAPRLKSDAQIAALSKQCSTTDGAVPQPISILKEFNTLKTLVSGCLKSNKKGGAGNKD